MTQDKEAAAATPFEDTMAAIQFARTQDPDDALHILFEGLETLIFDLREQLAAVKAELAELKARQAPPSS